MWLNQYSTRNAHTHTHARTHACTHTHLERKHDFHLDWCKCCSNPSTVEGAAAGLTGCSSDRVFPWCASICWSSHPKSICWKPPYPLLHSALDLPKPPQCGLGSVWLTVSTLLLLNRTLLSWQHPKLLSFQPGRWSTVYLGYSAPHWKFILLCLAVK